MDGSMTPIKIAACDDTKEPLSRTVQTLEKLKPKGSPPVQLFSGDQVTKVAKGLEDRRKAKGSKKNAPPWGSHEFDDIDLLILDYNFIDLKDASGLTGERLAYLARCYSSCGYIVVLNQFGKNRFDLTLSDHPDTFADLHVGSDQITNPGLWSTDGWSGFRPWYWPVLPNAVLAMRKRYQELDGAMGQPILKWLGLSSATVTLPRSVKQFLGSETQTFEGFVKSSDHGFQSTDRAFDESSPGRIAASRIAKWLEYLVFAGQDVLIDFPRVASRYPSLLGSKGLSQLSRKPLTPNVIAKFKLEKSALRKHKFQREHWLSKPAWTRVAVMDDAQLEENAQGLPPESSLRFSEDTSSFLPASQTRGFVADLASPFVQRHVRRHPFARVEYQPSLRFTL